MATAVRPPLQSLRAMFYAVTPNETSYATWEEVPNFVDEVINHFNDCQICKSVFFVCVTLLFFLKHFSMQLMQKD